MCKGLHIVVDYKRHNSYNSCNKSPASIEQEPQHKEYCLEN